MQNEHAERPLPCIVGRTASHFTRALRIVAVELALSHTFRAVPELLAVDMRAFAQNPALRIPVLETESGTWFGALNGARELARRAERKLDIVWPEQLAEPLLANAQELALQAMANEVTLIMQGASGVPLSNAYTHKTRQGLVNTLGWLDAHVAEVLSRLPPRDLSFLEVTLFCLQTHLVFRELVPVADYTNLAQFAATFARRDSASQTPYRFS